MFYGLIIIALAWFVQLYFFWKGHRSLQPWFLRLSALGTLILVLETFSQKNIVHSLPALVSLILILVLVWKIGK